MKDKILQFQEVVLEDMIPHDVVLERYIWLSSQILNKWLSQGLIRCFYGKSGARVYPKTDLDNALSSSLVEQRCEQEAIGTPEQLYRVQSASTKATAPAEISEADRLREARSMRLITGASKKYARKKTL